MNLSLGGSLRESACNWSVSDHVLKDAFHSLTVPCNITSSDTADFDTHLGSPATFFTQTVRLSLSLCLLIIIAACFNCVTVLGRSIYSTATCSLYWIIVMALVALRSGLLMVLLPVAATVNHSSSTLTSSTSTSISSTLRPASSDIIMGGFITITVVQSIVVYCLFLALDHEQLFRSPDFASEDSPFHHSCISLTWRRLLCSWYRVAMAAVTLLPLALLVAIEIKFAESHDSAPSPLVWVFVATLVLPRLCVLAMAGVLMFRAPGKLQPTVAARLLLLVALLLSLLEEVPSSVIAAAPFGSGASCHEACILELTVYDLFQIFGAVSLIFYTLFVRSQYLRVEQECKLALVWDLQKLLQVNGRQDVVAH